MVAPNLNLATKPHHSALFSDYKDEMSRALLAGLRTLNGKPCSFLPLESGPRRTYILMGVSRCITTQLLLQDEQVQDAERMTRWDIYGESDALRVTTPDEIQQGLWKTQDEALRKGPHSSVSTAKSLATWPGHAGRKARHTGTVLETTLPVSAKGTKGLKFINNNIHLVFSQMFKYI